MLTVTGAEQALLTAMRSARPYPLTGPSSTILVRALAEAVVVWGVRNPLNLLLQGTSTGAAGTGTINPLTSRILIGPNDSGCLSALSSTLRGPLGPSVASALSLWVSVLFSTQAQYQGNSVGVGVGTDLSTFRIVNQSSLESELVKRLKGPGGALYARGIAAGICVCIRGAVATAQVTGGGAGSPATGTTLSVVV